MGLFTGYKLFSPKKYNLSDATPSNNSVKFISEESLVNEIKKSNKIIPLEAQISESVIIDESFGNLDIFKKYKKIIFVANCSYSVDLSNLESSNLQINTTNNIIYLTLPKPTIYSIDIDEDKTVYEEPTLGLLRFGDIKLSSEEYGVIQKQLTETYTKRLQEAELYSKAEVNSKEALTTLVKNLTNNSTKVEITFK